MVRRRPAMASENVLRLLLRTDLRKAAASFGRRDEGALDFFPTHEIQLIADRREIQQFFLCSRSRAVGSAGG